MMELFNEVNRKLGAAGKPTSSRETFVVIMSVLSSRGIIKYDKNEVQAVKA